jgi:dolichyl-phosphate beta-glucosyltransferase
MEPHIVIVIPCYNEATRLQPAAFLTGAKAMPTVRFLFVNDGSTDRTAEMLDALHEEAPQHVAVCHLAANVGKAEAVRHGLLCALATRPTYVGYWDADLATPLATLVDFCALLDGRPELEMVFGARVRLLGRVIERRAVRHYLGRVFATAASLILSLPIYDTQCGAKLFRASPALHALVHEPFTTRWLGDIEIVARLIHARRGTALPQAEDIIYELPLPEWRDVAGSKVKAWDFAKGLCGLAMIYWHYLT